MAKHYESDITQFLQQLKEKRPEIEAGQRQGRSLLWDKNVDAELQEQFEVGSVAQKPYVYAND